MFGRVPSVEAIGGLWFLIYDWFAAAFQCTNPRCLPVCVQLLATSVPFFGSVMALIGSCLTL